MKLYITVLLLFVASFSNAQKIHFPYFFDTNEVDLVIDSLQKNNVHEILILRNESLKICSLSPDSILTIIIWSSTSGENYLKVICSDAIFRPIKVSLDERFFNYKNRYKVFVSKEEDVLKFVPPITNNNAIFYISNNKHGYFELNDQFNSPITYVPKDVTKEKFRKEWYDIIINSLNSITYNLTLEKQHDRYKGME